MAGLRVYRQRNVAGITIPNNLIDRLRKAKDTKKEGIKICVETIEELKRVKGVAGVHIMAIAWEKIVPEIVEQAGLKPRPKN